MPIRRLHRLIHILTLLQADPIGSAEALASQLRVHRRTILRDLAALRDAGVPVVYEPNGGYRLGRDFFMKPVSLEVAEALGLMVLTKSAAGQANQPLIGPAVRGVHKLVAAMREPMRSAARSMLDQVSISPERAELTMGASRWYAMLHECVAKRQRCAMHYRAAAQDELEATVIEPYTLHLANNAWYVVGPSTAHDGEQRVFKLARIEHAEPEGPAGAFEPPADWTADDKLGLAWRLVPGGEEHDVVLHFEPQVATNVAEVSWHATQCQQWLDDGRLEVRFRVDGLDEIAWWVCGYADQVQVAEPAELREKVGQMHRRAAGRHLGA